MRRFAIATLLLGLPLVPPCFSQSGAVIPEHGAGHAEQPSCVILKRMGPADQITSHLYSFGIRGKQFQYVKGKLPDGFPFHGRLTDHDVRNLQARNTEVIVLNQNYSPEELSQARADCRGETGKSPNQAEVKTTSATTAANPFTAATTQPPASAPTPASAASPASTASPAPPHLQHPRQHQHPRRRPHTQPSCPLHPIPAQPISKWMAVLLAILPQKSSCLPATTCSRLVSPDSNRGSENSKPREGRSTLTPN